MFGNNFTLFEFLGFRVRANVSWLFLAILVTWSLAAGFFPSAYPGLNKATYWALAVTGMIGLFFSLLFHEFSHSVVARARGLPMKGITLFLFGGVAEMEMEPPSAKTEFLMAIAGPISSVVLAVVFYGIALGMEAQGLPNHMAGVPRYLGFINLLLAAFNMVPGFPLDGGRVLRAALWHWKGDLRWATRWASRLGSGLRPGFGRPRHPQRSRRQFCRRHVVVLDRSVSAGRGERFVSEAFAKGSPERPNRKATDERRTDDRPRGHFGRGFH